MTVGQALGGFAAAWLDQPAEVLEQVSVDLVSQIRADGDTRTQYAHLMELSAILLGLALEQVDGRNAHKVRLAKLALTTLQGAGQLMAAAPGFVQPLDVVTECEHLAGLELADRWEPPPSTPPVRPANDPWPGDRSDPTDGAHRETYSPSPSPWIASDSSTSSGSGGDRVLVVAGLHRLGAVEDVVRAEPTTPVTIGIVSERPAELGPLARLVLGRTESCLAQASLASPVQVVHDEQGELADALGIEVIGNDLEYAARVVDGRVVSRAEGFGAAYAIARTAPTRTTALRGPAYRTPG